MFIPIHAKSDIVDGEGRKKGKITPAQSAQLNAWCLASKTGILDCLGKCEHAGDSNVFTAINGTATIPFKHGFFVICGRLIECEENSTVNVSTPATGEQAGKIIARYTLSATKEQEFVVTTKTGSLIQEDLNNNAITGVYEFELYSYIATPNAVTLQERTQPYIPDLGNKVQEVVDVIKNNISGTGVVGNGNPPLQGYDKDKGTIEERLTNLGFKEGSITGVSGATLTKQGKYAILTIPEDAFHYTANGQKTTTLTMSFTSASKIVSYIIFQETTSSAFIGNPYEITIEGNKITFTTPKISMSPVIFNRKFNIGFEISSW